jgi:hypothetical protein
MTTTDLEPFRRADRDARQVFVETDSDPAGLAAARVGIEHITHHGEPLRFAGSTYDGDRIEHRFRCRDAACPLVLAWSVTDQPQPEPQHWWGTDVPPTDTRQVLRDALATLIADQTVTVVGYEARTPMTAAGLIGRESARKVADALLAGPLADLAALPGRLHDLADELEAQTSHLGGVDGYATADRLRALTPDPRNQP